jgi:chaperonin cofactor prefoldin
LAAVIRSVDTKVERVEAKVDRLAEGQAEVRERLAHLEGESHRRLWSPSP